MAPITTNSVLPGTHRSYKPTNTAHQPGSDELHEDTDEDSVYPIAGDADSKDFTKILIFPMTVLAGER